LWAAHPENVDIGDGLARVLYNLGILLSATGRDPDAESAYGRSVEIRESLWAANPKNVKIKAGYAQSLCSVGRLDEAERLIDQVLQQVPRHPLGERLKRYIEQHRRA
jgi:thioredoxin-like negative regulator of GroEL